MKAPPAPALLSDDQRLAWLRLIRSDNIGPVGILEHVPHGTCSIIPGPVTFRELINHFGSDLPLSISSTEI